MDIVTLDFETYYDADYSLRKLATEEYIRDSRFEPMLCGVKINDGKTKVAVGEAAIKKLLAKIDWANTMLVGQNTRFDGAILAWHFGVMPKAYADTMGMSRALYPHRTTHSLEAQAEAEGLQAKGTYLHTVQGKRLASLTEVELVDYCAYCMHDVDLTAQLFEIYMVRGFPRKELELIDMTLRMFIEPVLRLNADTLKEHLLEVEQTREATLQEVGALLLAEANDPEVYMELLGMDGGGISTLLRSNARFAKLLEMFDVVPPTKVSVTTGKVTYAFAKSDEEFKALVDYPDLRVQALVGARLGIKSTLEESRTRRLLDIAQRGHAFSVPLQYYAAHSGRWGGTDGINLQNLPSRGVHAKKLKKAIEAPPGYVIIDSDSAQIEARTLAWLSGQQDLVTAFANKVDVYKEMASAIYSKPVPEITDSERFVGKVVILGAGYGIGAGKLQMYLKSQAKVIVDEEDAQHIVDTYRQKYPYIAQFWARGGKALDALWAKASFKLSIPPVLVVDKHGIRLPNGLHVSYPGLTRTDDGYQYVSRGKTVKIYGAKVIENVCQAVARLIIGEQMRRIAKRYRPVLTVHDSIAIIARIEEKAEAIEWVRECMCWTPSWAKGLPLACDIKSAGTYGG